MPTALGPVTDELLGLALAGIAALVGIYLVFWGVNRIRRTLAVRNSDPIPTGQVRLADRPIEVEGTAETLSRTAVEVADEAVQIHGGAGFVNDHDVERLYRDAKITQIHEGITETQRNLVARELLDEGT